MVSVETTISLLAFFLLVSFSLLVLFGKLNEINSIIREKTFYEESIFYSEKILEKLLNSSVYFFNFEVNKTMREQTIFLNLSLDCERKLNITSLKVFEFNEPLPFKINSYESCYDGSLKFLNISIFLNSSENKKIITLVLSSEGNNNFTDYEIPNYYANFSINFLNFFRRNLLSIEKLKNVLKEFCEKEEPEIDIVVFKGDEKIFSCNKGAEGKFVKSEEFMAYSTGFEKVRILLKILK